MKEEKRKTGIDVIGEVPWGTHLCQFYQTKEDLIDILVPYFKEGLRNNEFCIWITSEPLDAGEAEKAMKKAMPEFDEYLKRGQIEIKPHSEWYLKGGTFDLKRVFNAWIDKLNQAISDGYDGMRVTGNTAWLEKKDWRSFTDYEEELNRTIGKYRLLAICTYSLDKCGAYEVIDVVSNHQFALIKQAGQWKIIESSERKQGKDETRQLNISYERLTNNANEAIFRVKAKEGGHVIYCNPAAERIFGYSLAEWQANPLLGFKLIHPAYKEKQREIIEQINKNKQPIIHSELGWITKDGKTVFMEYSITPIIDEKGEIALFESIGRDITERKKAEEKIESLAKFPSEDPNPVLRINSENKVLYMNEPVYIQLKEQGLSETDIFKILPENIEVLIKKALKENQPSYSIAVEVGNKVFSYNIIPIQEGKYVNLYGRDITERKKAREDLEAKNVALREVLEQLEVEKDILQKNVKTNIKKLILPTLKKLKTRKVFPKYIDLLQRNLEGLTTSFGVKISEPSLTLSPKEIEICDMIKDGYTNKENADFLNITVQTVEKHRKNIRKKLGIAHKKINLTTYLQHL
jgi:PAS domain S-box-containing protein